jgi:hypothetical protein
MIVRESIPTKPEERKIIVPMKKSKIKEISGSQSGLDEPGICVLQWPVKEDMKNEIYRKLEKKISLDKVLIQSPYDTDVYKIVNPKDPTDIFNSHAIEKHLHLVGLCKRLGAISVNISHEKRIDKNEETKGEFSFSGVFKSIFSSKADSQKKEQEKLKEKFDIQAKFEPSEIDIEEAEKYLKEYGLDDERHFKHLLDYRRGKNKLGTEKISLITNNESKSSLELVAQINFKGFNIDGKFSRTVENKEEYSFLFDVDFRKEP